jgi:hypoxanthine-DNA glycosylase
MAAAGLARKSGGAGARIVRRDGAPATRKRATPAVAAGVPATTSTPAPAPVPRRQHGLPPVLAPDTRVLVLGSFPGEASLSAQAYYAHPRNHFWPIVGALLGEPLAGLPYPERLARLLARRIGLWDTIVACERRGSLDGAIRNAERGDVARVRRAAPALVAVAFNGQTAGRAAPAWQAAGYATLALPSTSPAYTQPLATKLAAWRALLPWLDDAPAAVRDRAARSRT